MPALNSAWSDCGGFSWTHLDTLAEFVRHGRNLLCQHALLDLLLVQAGPDELSVCQLPEEHAKCIHVACLADLALHCRAWASCRHRTMQTNRICRRSEYSIVQSMYEPSSGSQSTLPS